jgi:hypothetical protein
MPLHDPITGAQVKVNDDRSLSVSMGDPVSGTRMGVGADGSLFVAPHPKGATPVSSSSGNVAQAQATIAAVVGKTSYLSGFSMSALGATAGSTQTLTIAGLAGGNRTLLVLVPAGAGTAVNPFPLIEKFDPPLAASAPNTAITVTLPALGAGNTNAMVNAEGYQL